jgi:hypothetical protein
MRYLPLVASVALFAGCYAAGVHAQPYGNPPGYHPASPPPPPPPAYAAPPGTPYPAGRAPGGENCGTPDEPKPCPAMPRVPLQYYPANRP